MVRIATRTAPTAAEIAVATWWKPPYTKSRRNVEQKVMIARDRATMPLRTNRNAQRSKTGLGALVLLCNRR